MDIQQRWHIGVNTVGYIPNEDPYCMEGSEEDAANAARDEAIRALDCDGTCDLRPADARRGFDHPTLIHSEDEDLDDTGDYYLDETDCGNLDPLALHIWYAACDQPEECAAEDCRTSGNPCDLRFNTGACAHGD